MENIPVLPFSYNWNNKLDCECFSSIRIWNDRKYIPGTKFKVVCKGKSPFIAELVISNKIQIQHFTEYQALIDTGYSLKKLQEILQKMYVEYFRRNGKTALFGIYIFKKVKE
jgi:hypothetical protein